MLTKIDCKKLSIFLDNAKILNQNMDIWPDLADWSLKLLAMADEMENEPPADKELSNIEIAQINAWHNL